MEIEYKIRTIKETEYEVLADFLYEAIYIPEGMEAPPGDIIEQSELQVYISDFGKNDDYCVVAEAKGMIIGAAWARIMNDYGHIDNKTPSLAISLYREYRGIGIGTKLMERLLMILKENGYKRVSLSVQKANDACHLYQRLGFEIIEERGEELLMVKQWENEMRY